MPPKKAKLTDQVKGDEAEELLRIYLKDQYRPYAVPDLILNLHNKINKPTMVKVLDQLVEKGEIISKTYGKSVYYASKEITMDSTSESTLNESILDDLKENISKLENEAKNLTTTLRSLVQDPTNEEAQNEIVRLEEEIEHISKKLDEFQQNDKVMITKEVLNSSKEYSVNLERVFQNRRKIFLSFLGLVNENIDDFKGLMAPNISEHDWDRFRRSRRD